jgi:SAM-dependent methyltransferase
MNQAADYIDKNKALWNKRTDYHFHSQFYDLPNFITGKSSLNEIELPLLGDITGKSILHLQCHFGQDTISLARMGASVTGVDFSDNAIKKAQELASQLNNSARFICCNLYDLPLHLNEKFDIVFTSYGTIGWLPDLDKWAKIISDFLQPKGIFILVEFHPVVWMFDNNFEEIAFSYFKSEPITETEQNTYADREADVNLESVTWNHSLSEVFQSLVTNGMRIHDFKEYAYSPYDCFNDCEKTGEKKFAIKKLKNKIPMVYSIVAVKE